MRFGIVGCNYQGVIREYSWLLPGHQPGVSLANAEAPFGIVTGNRQDAIREHPLSPPPIRYSEASLSTTSASYSRARAFRQVLAKAQFRRVPSHHQNGIWARPWSPTVCHSVCDYSVAVIDFVNIA